MKIQKALSIVLIAFLAISTNFPKDWSILYTNEQITVEYKEIRCQSNENGTDNNYLILKFTNKTNKTLQIQFTNEVHYNGQCVNCDISKEENNKSITLNPNETIEGKCSSDKTLKVFSKMNTEFGKTSLTNYTIKNIQVQPLN